jgi:antitoxin component YwqK of YwqJK toxin-antitoxin module
MKNLLSILTICFFVSCSPERVHIDDLQEREEAQMLFYQGKPFTGIAYEVYSEGQLNFEIEIKDGKTDGLGQEWYDNGQLHWEANFKDGQPDGLFQEWDEDGQLEREETYKDGERIN